jgi:hypothetical protein
MTAWEDRRKSEKVHDQKSADRGYALPLAVAGASPGPTIGFGRGVMRGTALLCGPQLGSVGTAGLKPRITAHISKMRNGLRQTSGRWYMGSGTWGLLELPPPNYYSGR